MTVCKDERGETRLDTVNELCDGRDVATMAVNV